MVNGDKAPFYGETLEELGLYKAQTRLPFNAFGTMAMARELTQELWFNKQGMRLLGFALDIVMKCLQTHWHDGKTL